MSYSRPFLRIIEATAKIAQKMGATIGNTGDRLADNIEAIAEANLSGGGVSSYNDLRDRPFNVADAETVLFSETVTATEDDGVYVGILNYQQLIDNETITVVFDGTEYTCPLQSTQLGNVYGATYAASGPDFTEFPFTIASISNGTSHRNAIATETEGTHTVIVKDVKETVTTTEDFDKAVKSIADPCKCLVVNAVLDPVTLKTTLDKTWSEINAADFAIVIAYNTETSTKTRGLVTETYLIDDAYFVMVDGKSGDLYQAVSEDGYPHFVQDEAPKE